MHLKRRSSPTTASSITSGATLSVTPSPELMRRGQANSPIRISLQPLESGLLFAAELRRSSTLEPCQVAAMHSRKPSARLVFEPIWDLGSGPLNIGSKAIAFVGYGTKRREPRA